MSITQVQQQKTRNDFEGEQKKTNTTAHRDSHNKTTPLNINQEDGRGGGSVWFPVPREASPLF